MSSSDPLSDAYKHRQRLHFRYVLAWFLCAIFYFYQYAARATPGIMQATLTEAWGHNPIGTLVVAYYIAYAIMALISGFLLDRYGPHATIPAGITFVTLGSVFFVQGSQSVALIGFVLQAIGAIFAFLGASYVAAHYLPQKMLAIFVGLTECLGMAGAAFGSKLVAMLLDPIGRFNIHWQKIWLGFAVIGLILTFLTLIIMPRNKRDKAESKQESLTLKSFVHPFCIIFSNPQSWLSGIIGGLLFAPTTIGILAWGSSFFAKSYDGNIAYAATLVSMVPLGWVIGCPLIGYISDKIGLRRPVLIGGSFLLLLSYLTILYQPFTGIADYLPPLIMGIMSSVAMLPFSVMKEVNPANIKGTAAGVMNFLVFLASSALSPIVSLLIGTQKVSLILTDFYRGFMPLIIGIILAVILSFFLQETGWKRSKR
ncbi:MFS transporter [Zymomonas mobilis]|uniref:Lysosomal dipeptide transporter MFSD1 n=1 Tax=Zymomonas mobilis subsp. pomaceae (strain ATCC 29192 / DSM 22645 / JCM 10191 / CCUG 17912 / NBRC 13757 / NCIMB 11200 / NRRL B-4491 / Barker I) TaxID=579138 RepID=F8EUS1_ZYMMT|nr:MFS transporter [Zymomonas mobilis]AEI38217.1 major facilitator superfamily MFS_1 [Zymomonas mobilis subsp. pomaceae ATCC 29192]MDX5947907.1 MFS transporter [Zymomonas mobilis subsp. pomaceae]GEB89968.1 MFS transporter [Zymomonas mobilis subsp. pomaceae]